MICSNCGHDNEPTAAFCGRCGTEQSVERPAGAPSALAAPPADPVAVVQYAGFWIRFAAWVIDSFILFVLFTVGLVVTNLAALAGVWLLPFVYYWLFTGLRGQTPGKMVVGVKVVDEHGAVPGLGRAALREVVGKPISAVVFGLGFVRIAWAGQKRGWHDHIGRTYVRTSLHTSPAT